MSMNLECKEIELWQTPTTITNMCAYIPDPKCPGKVMMDPVWQNIFHRYCEWVRSHTNGVWTDEKAYKDVTDSVRYHLANLKETVDQCKVLHFEVM